MPKISVIVPVFNSERYLEKTMEAILNQDMKDMEVILVDDGSVDHSLEICHRYVKEDTRVSCFSIENRGPGHARNIGIEKSSGDWLAFCDADDIPNVSMYQKLFFRAVDTNADLCICDFYSERDKRNMGFPWDEDFFEGKDICNIFMASMIGNLSDNTLDVPFWGSSCRGIYNRTIIEKYNVRFPEDITFAEDLIFNLRYAMYCDKIAILRESLYYYTFNEASVMNSHCCRYVENMFQKRKILVQYIERILNELEEDDLLRMRLRTTERCYYSECIGNACTKSVGRSVLDMIRETKEIMEDRRTRDAFLCFDAKVMKKKILYLIVRYRQVYVAFVYYRVRLFRRER